MVTSGKTTGTQIMNNAYTYDRVDNVLSVSNSAPLPSAGGMGGQMTHTYSYDGLYRLKAATGSYTGADKKTAGYTLEMAYDNLHNIVNKKQHVEQNGIQFDGTLKAGYDLNYTYSSENPHQIKNIKDVNYRTEEKDAQDVTKKEHDYQYDKNGNLIYVNTAREKKDGENDVKANERKLLWDEENRLQAIDDNGFVSNYWYDAAGERTVKTSGESEHIYVNSAFSGGLTETANFTAYISPYIVISQGGQYTKHIYIGSQRIVSKLGDLDSYGADPRRIEYAGTGVDGAKVDYKTKYQTAQQEIKDRYAYFEVPYKGVDNDDYVNGQGFCCDNSPKLKSVDPSENDNPELFQYYYHSDHLGSSSLITNLDGEIVQHVEYVPFGEVFIEERNNKWNTPYLFNAKELDEETGLYYYGARYYEPRVSQFLSVDRFAEKYPFASSYQYCLNNPVNAIDVNGDSINVAKVQQYDKDNKTNYFQTVLNDLSAQTGLTYSVSNSGMLVYSKDANSNAQISTTTDANGNTIQVGSQEARSIMTTAIDHNITVDVKITDQDRSKSIIGGAEIRLDPSQINSFIKNANGLDNKTLGWGMTLMHETLHSVVGGSLRDPSSKIFGETGAVVDRMNIIRTELNKNGGNYGQRLSYPSYSGITGSKTTYLPFDKNTYDDLLQGLNPMPAAKSKFIKIVTP